MVKVKVVYMNGKDCLYDVEYPKAYVAKIIERENNLLMEQKSIAEIYVEEKLVAQFRGGYINELVVEKSKQKGIKEYWTTDNTAGNIPVNYTTN